VVPGRTYTPALVAAVAWRRKWLILLPAVVVAAGLIKAIQLLPDTYESTAVIQLVPQRVPESYVRPSVTQRIDERLQSLTQQILSRTRLEKIIQDLGLYPDRRSDIMEDVVERMRKDIDVRMVRGNTFRVTYSGPDPRTVMRVTERLASLFIDESLKDRAVIAEDTSQFLETQLEDARRRLVEVERRLGDYRRQHEGELPSQLEGNVQALRNTQMQLQALTDLISRGHDRRLLLERLIADASVAPPAAAPEAKSGGGSRSDTDDVARGRTAGEQLKSAQEALAALRLRLTPQHPDVIRLERTIAELQRRAEAEQLQRPSSTAAAPSSDPAETLRRNRLNELNTELGNLNRELERQAAEEKRLRDAIAEYQRRIDNTPSREAEMTSLTRDYETLQQLYRNLLQKKEDSQIAENLERRQIGEQFTIVDPPQLPQKPVAPDRPRLYVLAVGLGLAVGLVLGGAAEYRDSALRSEQDARAALNLPVLACVPFVPRRRRFLRFTAAAGAGSS